MITQRLIKGALFLAAIFIVSCKKESRRVQEIRTDKSVLIVSAKAGVDSILVTATDRWKITKPSHVEWLLLSIDSGYAGATTVYFGISDNVSNESRTADIIINSSENNLSPAIVKITQAHDLQVSSYNRSAQGGGTIEIYGTGFSKNVAENLVTINGLNATVQSANNTVLKVTVPPGAGSGPIIVSDGTIADTSYFDFIYEWVGELFLVAGTEAGYADGPVATAKLYGPERIRFDKDDNLYVADYQNNKIRKVTPSGIVSSIPGRFAAWDNPGAGNTDYGLPTSMVMNDNGEMFIVEYNSSLISKYIPPNSVNVFAGGTALAHQDGNGTDAQFYRPVDIAMDSHGNLFVADMDNLCIRKITPGAVVTTFAGGTWGYQDGVGQSARFNRPSGIAIDPQDNLYVADYYNNRIRKITANGAVTTFAGTGSHGTGNGDALTEATFFNPKAIAVGLDGTVYVGQTAGENHIRLIKPNGIVESITAFKEAGSGTSYQFGVIGGLAIDKRGSLYASDYSKCRIFRIDYK